MLVLWAFEWLLTISLIVGVATQVVFPLWNGTSLFPAVRRRKLHRQVEEAAEALDATTEAIRAAELDREARQLRRRLHDIDGEGR